MPRAGVGESLAYSTLVLRPAAGDLHLKIRHRGGRGGSPEIVVEGVYDSGEQAPFRDVARRHRMFPRGAGYSSRPGALEVGTEWDAVAESENACYRFGFICPSGEQTAVSVTSGWGICNKIIEFNDDLFFIFLNRIAYLDNGSGSLVDLYTSSGDTFHDAEIWGDQLRVAEQCTHSSTGIHFFVSIAVGAPYTVINPTPSSPAGTAATADTPQLEILATVFWEYQGVADFRLAGKTDAPEQIRWMTTPTGDPYDKDNWGVAVSIGPTTDAIQELVSSHKTMWVLKNDGCYAVRDATASAGGENLTPYWQHENVRSVNGMYWRDKLITNHGGQLESIDVNSWQIQDRPHPISIEFGRPNNTKLGAIFYTALSAEKEWLVAALKNVDDNAYVLYGIERARESATGGVTEYDWFAEVGPITGAQISYLYVYTPDDGTPSGGRPSLWIAYEQASTSKLMKVDLFRGGSPLADSGHRYTTASSVTFTDEHFASRAAIKGALRGELSVRGCGSGRKVDFYAVAGAGAAFPGSPNASITTNIESSTFALTSVRGNVIRSKAVLTSTATVPVVIDEMGLKGNLGFPLRRRGTWLVELSDQTEGDLPSFETPSTVEAALRALCESVEAFDVLDDEGNTMTVVLDNALPWRKEDGPMTDLGTHQKVRLLEVGWQEVG